MSKYNLGSGCTTIILAFLGIIYAYNFFIVEPQKIEKENKQLEHKWSKNTIEFISKFDCNKLKYLPNIEHSISKFFVIESHLNQPCEINSYTNTDQIFSKAENINRFYTKKIDEANTIIWIQSIGGDSEAIYGDNSNARRLVADIKFIDKEKSIIYKSVKIEFTGVPKEFITRNKNGVKGTDVYFGEKPFDSIFKSIELEITK